MLRNSSHGSNNNQKVLFCNRAFLVADFETTTELDDCRVWGWGLTLVDKQASMEDVIFGSTIEDFFDVVSTGNYIVFFHHLAFDGSFILDILLRNEFSHVTEYTKPGTFKTLISRKSQFYSITVHWRNGKVTEFRDSLKKIPMTVDRMAKAFNVEQSKLIIDYKSYRPVGHEITPVEKEYIAADVVIVARALAQQLDEGMTKLTVGADSMAEFKKLFGGKLFARTFPVLSPSMDAEIRKAYRGGWTICPKRLRLDYGKNGFKGGSVYDVNSLYPSVMKNSMLPHSVPRWIEGEPEVTEEFPLFIVSITFMAKIKKNHLPCIQVKGSSMFGATEYLEVVDEPTTLSITNVDLELWEKHYDLDILSYNGGWKFRGFVGFFDEYIDKWSDIKAKATGGLREIAKLHLNSLYGKFATNPNITGKYPIMEDGVVELVLGPDETRDPVYTAMGVFITAYARQVTITAAQLNYSTFAYADTDSIHLTSTEPPVGVVVDPSRLGAWKHEYDFSSAVFWRTKAYSEIESDGTQHTHVAGLPVQVAAKIKLDDFVEGKVFDGKLLPKRVEGGIVLVDATYTLK